MAGEYRIVWLKQFKIAVVGKDASAIARLIEEMPAFETPSEREEALYLCREARAIITSMQEETGKAMRQLEANRKFLKSAHADAPPKLDITS